MIRLENFKRARVKFPFQRPAAAIASDHFQPIRVQADLDDEIFDCLAAFDIISGDLLAGLVTDDVQAGDLVFVLCKTRRVSHIGIYHAEAHGVTLECGCSEPRDLEAGEWVGGRIVGVMREGEYITPPPSVRPIIEWPELVTEATN